MTLERIPIRLTVTTPMFIGVDRDRPALRAESIRGVLRFWFRSLVGREVGGDLAALHKLETAVFGGVRGKATQSPFTIRVVKQFARAEPPGPTEWLNGRPGVGYLLGQGLSTPPSRDRKAQVTRSHFAVDQQADLELLFRHPDDRTRGAVRELVLASLWFASAFGGLGARAHRGFGGFQVDWINGPGLFPAVFTDQFQPITSQVERSVGVLVSNSAIVSAPADPPSYPVFDSENWSGVVGECDWRGNDWSSALHRVGVALRNDLAPIVSGRNRTSEEFRYIAAPLSKRQRPTSTVFPRAAFGLPVLYPTIDATVSVRRGQDEMRRASAVWVRCVRLSHEPTKVFLMSHAFHSAFLPDDYRMEITAGGGGPEVLTLDQKSFFDRIQRWLAAFEREFE